MGLNNSTDIHTFTPREPDNGIKETNLHLFDCIALQSSKKYFFFKMKLKELSTPSKEYFFKKSKRKNPIDGNAEGIRIIKM